MRNEILLTLDYKNVLITENRQSGIQTCWREVSAARSGLARQPSETHARRRLDSWRRLVLGQQRRMAAAQSGGERAAGTWLRCRQHQLSFQQRGDFSGAA